MDSTFLHALVVVVYLVVLIAVGALKALKIKSQEDFSLAGRGLPTFVLVGTLLATWIGTGSIFGNAQKTYQVGVPAFLLVLPSCLGILLLWALAARIRRFGQFTIQDILEARFGVAARILGTITLVGAYVIIVSYQYRAGAAVIDRIAPDIGEGGAKVMVAGFVIVYTALAGMFSVAYTDVANGVLMSLGLAIALPLLYMKAGGVEGVLESLPEAQRGLGGMFGPFELVSVLLPALLLLLGDANMYQRFFSAKSPEAARRSALGMLVGVFLLESAIIAIALAGKALVAQRAIPAPENEAHVVIQLAFDALPPALGALLVATVVAVVVSTADSYLLSPATAVVRDVYQRFVHPSASPRIAVLVGRAVVVLLGLAALGLAFQSYEFFHVALFAYTLYGVGITPAILAAFFWRRASTAGAVASMATGVGTALLWRVLIEVPEGAEQGRLAAWATRAGHDAWAARAEVLAELGLDAVLPSLAVSLTVLILVSLATPRPTEARLEAF